MNCETILVYILITVLFALFGYFVIKYAIIDNVAPFVSNYDGKNYDVREVGDDSTKQTAANYLAQVSARIDDIVNYMYEHKLPNEDTANRLYSRWGKCELKETNSNEKSAAYTLNKSTEIRLCIRKTNGEFENLNTSMFVSIHELAHMASISYGHNEEFTENFVFITHLASSLGLYKPEDYINNPKTYCGVEINTTPCVAGSCEYKTRKL